MRREMEAPVQVGASGEYVKDRSAVVGVGYTEISKNSGQTILSLAIRAGRAAILDAGLRPEDVDGVITYHFGDSIDTMRVADGLGLPRLRWFSDIYQGGNAAVLSVAEAAMVVASGAANAVLVYRALNGRSGYRWGRYGVVAEAAGASQYTLPYGYASPPQMLALWCRRYMHEYGLKAEQLGEIAITCRKHASLNERALMRKPITMQDYLASRYIAEPFRMLDCCVEVDGACAVLVTSAEKARDCRHRPVYISGFSYASGPRPDWEHWANGYTKMYPIYAAPDLWKRTGFAPKDMDFVEFYDCFTYTVLCTLEDWGFCAKGEGGSFVEGGRIAIGGELPINTHGGLLSEGYLHGLNHTCEAVSQLRGGAGARQVPDAEVCLVTAGAGPQGGGIVYHR